MVGACGAAFVRHSYAHQTNAPARAPDPRACRPGLGAGAGLITRGGVKLPVSCWSLDGFAYHEPARQLVQVLA
jgi:hypothetical protein